MTNTDFNKSAATDQRDIAPPKVKRFDRSEIEHYLAKRMPYPDLEQRGLTKIEIDICRHWIQGFSTKEIAQRRGAKFHTTGDHKKKLLRLFGLAANNDAPNILLLRQVVAPMDPDDMIDIDKLDGEVSLPEQTIIRDTVKGKHTKAILGAIYNSPGFKANIVRDLYEKLAIRNRLELFALFFMGPDEGELRSIRGRTYTPNSNP